MSASLSPSDPVTYVKGVGKVRADLLAKLGIFTVEDLLWYFPRRYEDRRNIVPLRNLVPGGAPQAFRARVVSIEQRRSVKNRRMTITRSALSDGESVIWAVWFNRRGLQYLLKPGMELALFASLRPGRNMPEVISPEFEILNGNDPQSVGCIVPIYPMTAGVNDRWFRKTIGSVVKTVAPCLPDVLPEKLRAGYGFPPIGDAVMQMHNPTDEKIYTASRRRLAFEEFFMLQTGLALRRRRNRIDKKAPALSSGGPLLSRFMENLPFRLTSDQKKVCGEISADMEKNVPMNRLLQGDVGSGKTIVAVIAMLQALDSGVQTALMAPTAVLAEQHFHTLSRWLHPLGVQCALLTGGTSLSSKKEIISSLAEGSLNVVIGTHALIQETVEFKRLGLIVIDEQHRFGVLQRRALNAKGNEEVPRTLVMTATPIPRTLALSVYGDLTVSSIRTLPAGRQPIRSVLIGNSRLAGMLRYLDTEIEAGRQVYWICPLIEESENFDAAPLEFRYEQLVRTFSHRRVAMLHGRMNDKEKTSIMQEFAAGKIDILASTTVIEVGVDVPNATCIIIENAEHFGLSQLHQLRGRVGRGKYKSWCILYSQTGNPETLSRLRNFCRLRDGFEISEADMKLRGPGEFCGIRQHGLTDFRVADLLRDRELMEQARTEAFNLVRAADFEKKYPELYKTVLKHYGKQMELFTTA